MPRGLEFCRWYPFSDEPVLWGKSYIPKYCDPQVLLPEQSCDGKWHMFFHSWIGVHHYVSTSGIAWEPRKMIALRGHSPFIFIENENYYLIYERHDRHIPFVNNRSGEGKKESYSVFELVSSTDLETWCKPRLILDSRTIPFSGDYLKYPRISRPQLIRIKDEYRLYFGASHLVLPDTGQKVSRYFSCASSMLIDGPYVVNFNEPLLSPQPDDPWSNLGCGSIRVIKYNDVLYGFQCPVFWDSENKRTSSSLILLKSTDGYSWERCGEGPILTPSNEGWTSKYIMGCDVHLKSDEKCWYCYYSAIGERKLLFSKESVGLLLGKIPSRLTEPR